MLAVPLPRPGRAAEAAQWAQLETMAAGLLALGEEATADQESALAKVQAALVKLQERVDEVFETVHLRPAPVLELERIVAQHITADGDTDMAAVFEAARPQILALSAVELEQQDPAYWSSRFTARPDEGGLTLGAWVQLRQALLTLNFMAAPDPRPFADWPGTACSGPASPLPTGTASP